jgi:hypothetical protein
LTEAAPVASIPAAWLKPLPNGYKIPLWRWIVLPATTYMLKRNAGAWVNGTLVLADGNLRFIQTKLTKSARNSADTWTLPLSDISDIGVEKALASERIEIRYVRGTIKLMSVRSADFVALLQQALQ